MDLETILSPYTVAVFLDEYFGRNLLHVPGSAAKFSALEDSRVLALELERTLEAPVRVRTVEPAPLSCLERDVLILQISGPCQCPVRAAAEGRTRDVPLREGDALYIPRGWWFTAAPGDPSVQLGFEIENPTGADLLDWMFEHVKEEEACQKDIPRFADPAERADYVRVLRRMLVRVLRAPGLLERYRRETNLCVEPTPTAATPGVIAILTPRKIRIKRADDETLLLVAIGKRLAFPKDAAPLLHYICDQAPVPVVEFYNKFEGEFEREELSDLLSVLSGEGIIGF